jgi:hypothetical protein
VYNIFPTSIKKFISLPEYGDCWSGGIVRHNGAAAGIQVHTIQLENQNGFKRGPKRDSFFKKFQKYLQLPKN